MRGVSERPGYERIEGVAVGQYVAYTFFKVDRAWRRLPVEQRLAAKEAFAEVVDEWQGRIEGLRAYTTVGVRPDADFFLWKISRNYDDLVELGAALNATPLAGWLETPYSYLATTKQSHYTDRKRVRQGQVVPRDARYLVVYPFVKRRPWYFLSPEERGAAMREHADVGAKYVTMTNHTTYSFGIDDQEFIPAFECDEPADFMHLMLALRETEASRWTERDTPIFVGARTEIRAALDGLDGAGSPLRLPDAPPAA
ncbi:MAG: chlorite dismutase [Thermoleophilia bacterium]|nr:chlorite dismutase [Thermoleophilia bacterium]